MAGFYITVYGLVQGVGFRPFVARTAESLGIYGNVRNSGGIVKIYAEGQEEAVEEFIHRLSFMPPFGTRIDRIEKSPAAESGKEKKFSIISSTLNDDELRFLPPDIATCDKCTAELTDISNRRYRHPFISCTACGPRYTIMKSLPYDRDTISMAEFDMCPRCLAEYTGENDRRRHAQTIACTECGPVLSLFEKEAEEISLIKEGDSAIFSSVTALKNGKSLALKDVGGYHFAFDAKNEGEAERLRRFKNREKKPFAVMFKDIAEIREYCEVSKKEEELLLSPARPIVLLEKNGKKDLAPSVCAGSDKIGAMLPSDPIQILILTEISPLVMTSGNRGGEPIITDDNEMLSLMKEGYPDLVLANNRKIISGLDDSVMKATELSLPDGNKRYIIQFIRRARGFVPQALMIKYELEKDTFAAGGDLKNCFALGKKNACYLSGHFGDLYDYKALKKRKENIARLSGLLNITPKEEVCDRHPAYVSAKECTGEVRRVYHHHAHILGVMGEHKLDSAIGLAFDGTGFGADGSIWGGEFFTCEMSDFVRSGHLAGVMLPGGDAAAKNAAIPALAYLFDAKDHLSDLYEKGIGFISTFTASQKKMLEMAIEKNVNTVRSTSMGRLFDAVAALTGICTYNSYEGECAIKLEIEAKKTLNKRAVPLKIPVIKKDGVYIADTRPLIRDIVDLRLKKVEGAVIALAFHRALVKMSVEMTERIAEDLKIKKKDVRSVALAGGSFYNDLLLKGIASELTIKGFEVYVNEKVPSGDGGLALGQLTFAAMSGRKKSPV